MLCISYDSLQNQNNQIPNTAQIISTAFTLHEYVAIKKEQFYTEHTEVCTSYSAPQSRQADDYVSFLKQNEKYKPL